MATHDYVIANGTGQAVRQDLNNALAAIVSNNSGSSEPGTTYAYQWWADTNANVLKIRNSANNAWITLRELDGTMLIEDGDQSTPGLAFAEDINTGIFRPAADKIAFATGGAERLEIGTDEVVVNDLSNDVNFRVESNGNTHMLFVDGSADAVGFGTSSPNHRITIASDTTGNFDALNISSGNTSTTGYQFGIDGDGNAFHWNTTNSAIKFATNNTEQVRLDSSGRLLVGTSSSRGGFFNGSSGFDTLFQIEQPGYATASIVRNSNNTAAPNFILGKTRGTSNGATTVVSSGDVVGEISFQAADGAKLVPAASIEAEIDGTPGSSNMPGRLVFSTTSGGSASPTERMRLNKSGDLNIGSSTYSGIGERLCLTGNGLVTQSAATTNRALFGTFGGNDLILGTFDSNDVLFRTANNERMRITDSGNLGFGSSSTTRTQANRSIIFTVNTNGDISINHSTSNSSGDVYLTFGYNGTAIGSVTQNGNTAVLYNTTSDYRLKENVVDLDGAITRVKQLAPKRFNFIVDDSRIVDGFLAHEAQAVVPEAVTGTHDEVDDDGNAVMQGIDHSKLVPLLTAALKEAIAKIETLETKVAALEAG